jgi:hypothetical protein
VEEASARSAGPDEENGGGEREEANDSEKTEPRTTELQNSSDREQQKSSSKEDKNYSSVEEQFSEDSRKEKLTDRQPSAAPDRASGATSTRDAVAPAPASSGLPIFPDERPDLSQKLGPYVSADVDDALEDVYLLLRRRFGAQASKSLVVEVALRYILRDCLDREEESELMRWFDRVLDT